MFEGLIIHYWTKLFEGVAGILLISEHRLKFKGEKCGIIAYIERYGGIKYGELDTINFYFF